MPIVGQFGSLAGLGSMILPGGAMESIATVTVGSGGASSITFSDIPGTYQHLQVRAVSRLASGTLPSVSLEFNDSATSIYAYHLLRGNGASATAEAGTSQTSAICVTSAGGSQTASVFSGVVVDILDYASTSKNTTVRTLSGADFNGTGWIDLWSALWNNTSAITKVRVFHSGGTNFSQHTTFALYGVKAP
jgi:hypothetical protein